MSFQIKSSSSRYHSIPSAYFSMQLRRCIIIVLFFTLSGCGASAENPSETDRAFQTLSLQSYIDNDIFLVFDNLNDDRGINSCATSTCHHPITGQGGSFRIWPNVVDVDSDEMQQNYVSVVAFIRLDQPEASPLLLEPLAGSFATVGEHGGGVQFDDVDDPNYLKLYSWIVNASEAAEN